VNGPTPTARMVTVDGIRLETLEIPASRPDPAPPLVLLHEGLGSVTQWKSFPLALAMGTGRRVLAYSRRGHGRSDPLAAPRTPRFMEDEARDVLPRVLDAFDLPRDGGGVVLVGHSDGGSIALLHAAHPDRDPRPRAVVALAPHVFVEKMCVEAIAAVGDAYEKSGLRDKLAPYHRDPDHTFRAWHRVWLDDGFRSWNVEAALAGIAIPALVIQGRDDEYGTLAQVDAVHRGSGGRTDVLVLDGCGHAPHRDRPELVVPAIAAFVEATAASPAPTGASKG